jgi:hypothetical protein
MEIEKTKHKLKHMHSPFPFLIILIVSIPWGIHFWQEPVEIIQARLAARAAVVYFSVAFILYLFLFSGPQKN